MIIHLYHLSIIHKRYDFINNFIIVNVYFINNGRCHVESTWWQGLIDDYFTWNKWQKNKHVLWVNNSYTEMPTSGDLKSGDCLFLLPPPKILTQPPMEMTEDIIWCLTWRTYYQNSNARNNLCQWQKCPRNHTADKKNSSFELKMG